MAERTGGDWLDTGDGPKPLAVASGIALEGRELVAYRAYVDHARECADCPQSAFQCGVAAALWRAYRKVRD
ncbi:hypothetical protein ACIQCJ_00905 [Streptomyces sp. NPDC093221]|uniref:hypothetical protein n=1 Tax=Streptomyces sp. NPDC093221 TaxID=3366032 RepID=UPI0038126123